MAQKDPYLVRPKNPSVQRVDTVLIKQFREVLHDVVVIHRSDEAHADIQISNPFTADTRNRFRSKGGYETVQRNISKLG